MKKTILISLFVVLFGLWFFSATAKPVTEQQARTIAGNFMLGKALQTVEAQAAQHGARRSKAAAPAYYVFNTTASQGYVIVSGDDRTPQVLGYTDSGAFDPDNVHPALQELLDSYAAQISALDFGAEPAINVDCYNEVLPLVKTFWNQNAPYNGMMPFYGSNQCPAGYITTAVAQVMNYHQWPDTTSQAMSSYLSGPGQVSMESLPVDGFDWSLMREMHTPTTASQANSAVAKLFRYCAHAIKFAVLTNGSSSIGMPTAQGLINYFKYSPAMRIVNRDAFTQAEWNALLIDELRAKRPVIYSGTANTPTAFVVDGYDGAGRFHVNWGYGGTSNGYYHLNLLNPSVKPNSTTDAGFGYILNQSMLIGIEPDRGQTTGSAALYTMEFYAEQTEVTRETSADNFAYKIRVEVRSLNPIVNTFDFGMGLYSNGQLIRVSQLSSNRTINPTGGFSGSINATIGANSTSGSFELRPVYRISGTSEWLPTDGAGANYFELTINGNTLNINHIGKKGTPGYQVNSWRHSGDYTMAGMDITYYASITNTGTTHHTPIYVHLDGSTTALTQSVAAMAPGETAEVPFRFFMPSQGSHKIRLSLNADGSDPFAEHSIYSQPTSPITVSASIHINNMANSSQKIVNGNRFHFIVNFEGRSNLQYGFQKLYKIVVARILDDNTATPIQTFTHSMVFTSMQSGGNKQCITDPLPVDGKYAIVLYDVQSGEDVQHTIWSTYTFSGEPARPPVSYINENGEEQVCDFYFDVYPQSNLETPDGWYVIPPGTELTMSYRPSTPLDGNTHIIICDGAKLILPKGISVWNRSTLRIYGQAGCTGILEAHSVSDNWGYDYPAIGSHNQREAGNIVINGAQVYAYSYNNCAAIGGSDKGNATNIVINGGRVHAEAAGYGAAIGGGGDSTGTATATGFGSIIINGGEVYAHSAKGPGIGAGYSNGNPAGNGAKGDIVLNWRTPGTLIDCPSYYGNVSLQNTFMNDAFPYPITTADNIATRIVAACKVTFLNNDAAKTVVREIAVKAGKAIPIDRIPLINNAGVQWMFNGEPFELSTPLTEDITLIAGEPIEPVNYKFANNNFVRCCYYNVINADTDTLTDGFWVVDSTLTTYNHLKVTGNASIILRDGTELYAFRSINVPEGTSLTIYGQQNETGRLVAQGKSNHAGIGGDNHQTSGTIIIRSGRVEAFGNLDAAGIGGGSQGYWEGTYGSNGNVQIYGGTVKAVCYGYGAGIGGGGYGSQISSKVRCGNGGSVEIFGGNVTATSTYGYGIGPGSAPSEDMIGQPGTIHLEWNDPNTSLKVSSYKGNITLNHDWVVDGTYDIATIDSLDNRRVNAAAKMIFYGDDKESEIMVKGVKTGDIFPLSEAPQIEPGMCWINSFNDEPFDFGQPVYPFNYRPFKLYPGKAAGLLGDINHDGTVDVGDINMMLNYMLIGGFEADADLYNDGKIDVSDLNSLINILLGL